MADPQTERLLDGIAQSVAVNPPRTEQGRQLLDAVTESEQESRVSKGAENYNLAQDMDEGLLREIATEVKRGFDADDQTRTEWLDDNAFYLSLYMQKDHAESSDPDRDWGATESVPVLMEACNQFQARTYKAFFPNKTFVSAAPIRRGKLSPEEQKILKDRADRVGKHMSWQLGVADRTYKPQKDAMFLAVARCGSFFTKTYYDVRKRRPVIDNVRPTDLVVDYGVGPRRIEEVRRKTHVIHSTVAQTETLARSGFLLSPSQPDSERGKNTYDRKVDDALGLRESQGLIRKDMNVTLYEQHLYLMLEGDEEYRPYIATYDLGSNKILRLAIGWEAEADGTPMKDYEQAQYFTHYKFAENPDGFYGFGLGHFIGDLNCSINIMLRQAMDAATLANDGNMSGFMSERTGVQGDEMRVSLGRFRKIPDTANDLAAGIMPMKFPGPNAALFQIMQFMDARAQRIAATTESTTGTPDTVKQPTTYLAEIEQALEMLSSAQMRLANALGDELEKVFRLNQKYMPMVEYFSVNEAAESVTRADYKDDMLIVPIFDPKFATQMQKVSRAQAELNATLQNPVNQGRPQVYDVAFRRYLEALEVGNIDELLPPQPQPMNFDDQIVENMFFLQPKESRPMFDVFPDQDHARHLAVLEQFIAEYGGMLQPDQQEDILKHKQKHEGWLYGQQNGVIPLPGSPGQTPTPPMGPGQGDAMGAGAAMGAIPSAPGLNSLQNAGRTTSGGGQGAGS